MHLLVNELCEYKNARCNDKMFGPLFRNNILHTVVVCFKVYSAVVLKAKIIYLEND